MLQSDKTNKVSMQIPTDKINFNQTDDRSIQEIKLPTIWKHVLNDNSKAVETFPAKMAELIITTELNFFRARISLECKYFCREKNERNIKRSKWF